MEPGDTHLAEIQNVHIEHNPHRLRRFAHRILPSLVEAPPARHGPTDLRRGDKFVFASGRKRKVGMVIRSMEASRYAFTNRPLPDEASVVMEASPPDHELGE